MAASFFYRKAVKSYSPGLIRRAGSPPWLYDEVPLLTFSSF